MSIDDVARHHALHGGRSEDDVRGTVRAWLAEGIIDAGKLHLLTNMCACCGDYIALQLMHGALLRAEQPRFCGRRCRERMHNRERRARIKAGRKPTYRHVRPTRTYAGEVA